MKRTLPHKNIRGFSFVEVMIVIALFSLIIVALIGIVVSYYRIYTEQQGSIDTAYSASVMMSAIEKAALQSDRIIAAHSFSNVSYSSGTTTVIFEMPSVDAAGNNISGLYDYVGVYATGTVAYRLTDAAVGSARISATSTLSDSISAVAFTYDNSDFTKVTKIDADIQTSRQVQSQTIQAHVHQQIYLRNL